MAEQVRLQELSRKLCSGDAFLQASAFACLHRTLPRVLVSANTPLGRTESGHTNPREGLAAIPVGSQVGGEAKGHLQAFTTNMGALASWGC